MQSDVATPRVRPPDASAVRIYRADTTADLHCVGQLIPLYSATGILLYDDSEYNVRESQSILRVNRITSAVMETHAEVLRGMPVVEHVASRPNLYANPEFNASLRPRAWWQKPLATVEHLFHKLADKAL